MTDKNEAIKKNVPPLVWVHYSSKGLDGYYKIGKCVYTDDHILTFKGSYLNKFTTLEELKAAAQAHHVAQLTDCHVAQPTDWMEL